MVYEILTQHVELTAGRPDLRLLASDLLMLQRALRRLDSYSSFR